MALPVSPTIGGKGSNKLKSDMTGVSGAKPSKANSVGKKVGSIKKTMTSKGRGKTA